MYVCMRIEGKNRYAAIESIDEIARILFETTNYYCKTVCVLCRIILKTFNLMPITKSIKIKLQSYAIMLTQRI